MTILLRLLFDVFLVAGAVVWLNRQANRRAWSILDAIDRLAKELTLEEAEPLARVESAPAPELPAQCPAMRGAMRCTMEEGHEGSHSGRAGVSWG